MHETTLSLIEALGLAGALLAGAMAFLLIGWRLGRESAGRPMFDHPLAGGGEECPAGDPDPWGEAMHGPAESVAALGDALAPCPPVGRGPGGDPFRL